MFLLDIFYQDTFVCEHFLVGYNGSAHFLFMILKSLQRNCNILWSLKRILNIRLKVEIFSETKKPNIMMTITGKIYFLMIEELGT